MMNNSVFIADFRSLACTSSISIFFIICIIFVIVISCLKRKKKYYDWAEYLLLLILPLVLLISFIVFSFNHYNDYKVFKDRKYDCVEGQFEIDELKEDRTGEIWFTFSVGTDKFHGHDNDILNAILSIDEGKTIKVCFIKENKKAGYTDELFGYDGYIFIVEIILVE